MPRKLVIFGGGGFAREVAWLVAEINRTNGLDSWDIVGFLEQSPERVGQLVNGIPIIDTGKILEHLPDIYAVAAIGIPQTKERAVTQAERIGCKFATLVHPTVQMEPHTVRIGAGSIICAGNILTVNIRIGQHVILNLDCTVGHNTVIEDYVTISPGCHLSGYTTIRQFAYLGTGAVVIERHEIGAHATIGAGAVVIKDVPAGVTAVGVPARVKEE